MSVTIKYRGLKDGPVLLTADGRYPPTTSGTNEPDLSTAMGLWQASGNLGLKLQLKEDKQAQVLDEVYKRAAELSQRIDRLNLPADDLTGRVKTAVSSQPENLAAQADSEASVPGYYQAEVVWPSQAGEVLSKPQNPIEVVTGFSGEQSFTLVVEGVEHDITISGGGDHETQEEFLGRLARAIDMQDSRVGAEVEQSFQDAYLDIPNAEAKDRVVRLKIYATSGSQGADFYLTDAEGGDLISSYGLDSAPPSRPARIKLNSVTRDQSSDSFSLDNGHVSAQALDATDGAADIKVSQGPGVIQGEMKALLESYNGLMDYLNKNADLLRPALKDRIVRPLEDRWKPMRELGMNPKSSGKLEYSEKFQENLVSSFGQVREVLFDDSGWTEALQVKLDQILATDKNSFAWPLTERTPLQARKEAWDLVFSIGHSIISQYV